MTHHFSTYLRSASCLFFFALITIMQPSEILAQISQGKAPQQWNKNITFSIEWIEFEALDLKQLAQEDEATAKFKDAPWRFGIEHEVLWDAETTGSWSQEDGYDVWRLGVRAELATSWSFYFSSFDVPKGGELFVWNESRDDFLGGFTYANEKPWGGLALGLLGGSGVVLEYRQPAGLNESPKLIVSQAVQGYRSLLRRAAEVEEKVNSQGPFGNSGDCNINVNCPEGADWQVEKTAVALIVNGGFAACSGSMVNNTANDGTPYFLTANHCLGNPNTWTYYFNHESSTCSGNTGPTDMSISGGTLLVADGGADVALIELSNAPPASWGVEYAGWDASGATPENATGIHHPSGDLKKICFEEDSPYASSSGGAQVWWIDNWEDGVTEPGSSGSPLFDQNHRIIGQLYGGAAACSGSVNNGSFDYYGRFNVSWGLGVSEYLDPSNSGTLVLDGYPSGYNSDVGCTDPDACNYNPDATTDNGSCTELDACGECGGNNESCSGCTDETACNYDAAALVDDGSCIINGTAITFTLLTDNYPGETTWNIAPSADSTTILLEGGPYDDAQTTYTSTVCLAPGCYTLTVMDEYGDGLQYNSVVGDYTLTGENSTVLAEMIEGGDFGYQAVHEFCIGDSSVEGCTDDTACNYNAAATDDNSSCVYASGCDSCSGATDGTGVIVDGDGDNDGVCDTDEIAGCQDDTACNYNADATDAAACDYANEGFDCEGNPVGCPQDINGNGTVEVSDVLSLLSEFGCASDCGSADVNGDGAVSVSDVLMLLSAFGEEC